MEHNCAFNIDNNYFRYRAAAIIIEDDCVLLASNETDDYFYSVGGAVHINETSEDAVIREVFEETGVKYEIDHLAVIHENFFCENSGTHLNRVCHEIALYYVMKPRNTKELDSHSMTCGVVEKMNWIPINKLNDYTVYPTFFREFFENINNGILHYVTKENQ